MIFFATTHVLKGCSETHTHTNTLEGSGQGFMEAAEGLDLLRKRDQGRSSVLLVEGGVNLSRGASWEELGLLSRLDLFLSFFCFFVKNPFKSWEMRF